MAMLELKDENNTDSIHATNSQCTHFKCLELCKPIYRELMFTHYVNLVLRRQTFVSPTLITSSNHQKILQRYQGQSYKFCCDVIIVSMRTSWNLEHAAWFTKEFSIPNDFSLHFKATMTTTTNEILGGKEMQMLV